jgi:hypothetical protein
MILQMIILQLPNVVLILYEGNSSTPTFQK